MTRRKDHDHDADAFAAAMQGVKPVAPPNLTGTRTPRRFVPLRIDPAIASTTEDDGTSDFLAAGQQANVLRKLRRVRIPEQDSLDLHGFTVATAEPELRAFMQSRQQAGEQRVVVVIFGVGRRSPDGQPVLKHRVRVWLRESDLVLAFCPEGAGAVRVLLKRS